ncbi:MAG TPA: hypothetical protein VLF42_05215 [Burkholderiales bacterium]|nr:hypothetical protein [Burkholderiales bacterium]
MPTISSPATSRKTGPSRLAAALLLVAAAACAQAQGTRFAFATQSEARAALGAQDDYVRATSTLERPVVMGTRDAMDAARFAAAMRAAALEWSEDERKPFAGVLARLERFLSGMKWRAPAAILMVKASDRLMEGFPHTRGNAIVIQEGTLREILARPAMLEFIVVHEAFHVLTRANPALREELYSAIGFSACASVELPEALERLRLTNPDAPWSRHAIAVSWHGRPVEVLPFVHLASEAVEPGAGFASRMRTSWLVVERREERCVARDEGAALEELEGLRAQIGNNTGYLIHPEEILADNFALLYREAVTPGVTRIRSPEILERMRSVLF